MEKWAKVPGHPSYEVSSEGRARSLDGIVTRLSRWNKRAEFKRKGRILALTPGGNAGYKAVCLGGGNKFLFHRVVWQSFNGPIPKGMNINHKNGIKTDNRLENLELVTPKQNIIHGIVTGLTKKDNSGGLLLTEEEVRTIRFFFYDKKGPKATTSILGRIFKKSRSTIRLVARRKLFAHVK